MKTNSEVPLGLMLLMLSGAVHALSQEDCRKYPEVILTAKNGIQKGGMVDVTGNEFDTKQPTEVKAIYNFRKDAGADLNPAYTVYRGEPIVFCLAVEE